MLGNSLVNMFQQTTRNNTVEAFSMWFAPHNGMSAVFSAWSMLHLYNGSVFAAEIKLVAYRLVQSQD
jgi:hypothetical protein